MRIWVSPNGVEHTVDDFNRCATCGKADHPEMRKYTRFHWCPNHEWLKGERRYRQAEFAAEGGPGTPCTEGKHCKVFAGTEHFIPRVCVGEYVSRFGGW